MILQFYIPQRNKYGYILVLCAVLTGIWYLISRGVLLLLPIEQADYDSFYIQSALIRFLFAFLLIGCMALISVLWYTIQDQQEIEKRKSEAETLSREAELYRLRQQLQPHFLFNSLNSIYALIATRPQQARNMIQHLSDFLRGTLKKEENQWVSLDEELQHLNLYLEIEKVRFGHRLATEVINEAADSRLRLPSMLLQPVVENAIKFGLYDTTDAITIRIAARQEDGSLVVEVRNPYDATSTVPRKGTGFGLNSVQRRLYLLFARNDLLKTETSNNIFITTIKIPQQNDPGNHNR
jgi:LytS/YehU family sensor histidine kinase